MDKRVILERLDQLHYNFILREAGLGKATDDTPYSLGMRHGIVACREQLEKVREAIDRIEEPPEITEECPSCGEEVTLLWDTERDGYKAFCPYCGERLMLCSVCHDDAFYCDYDSKKDCCRFNPAKGGK